MAASRRRPRRPPRPESAPAETDRARPDKPVEQAQLDLASQREGAAESLTADTEAIDLSWEGERHREPNATLLDIDPLRHDLISDPPRSQADTLPDSDPLRYDRADLDS